MYNRKLHDKVTKVGSTKKGDAYVLHDVISNQVNQHLGDRKRVIVDSNTGLFHYVVLCNIAN